MLGDVEGFKSKVKANFETSGIQNIFFDDIGKMINLSASEEDLRLCKDLLLAIVGNELRMSGPRENQEVYGTMVNFFRMCKYLNSIEVARELWNNEKVKETMVLENSRTVKNLYFDHLFVNGHYQEILEEINKIPQKALDDTNLSFGKNNYIYWIFLLTQRLIHTSGALCCYKIGTKESLEKAVKLTTLLNRDKVSNTRAIKAAALLAFNQNELALGKLEFDLFYFFIHK